MAVSLFCGLQFINLGEYLSTKHFYHRHMSYGITCFYFLHFVLTALFFLAAYCQTLADLVRIFYVLTA